MKFANKVGGLKPGRSFFNLSYTKKFNCDMGKLIPVMCDEVVPGDVVKIGNEFVCRFEPMIAPIMQDVWLKVRYFFVPYRLMKRDCLQTPGDTFDWEEFLSDGIDGKTVTQILPRWKPTNNAKYSLWDYFGFPVGVQPEGAYPINFPREAYNFIWNNYFRNENLDQEVSLDNESLLLVRWNKDYFTSALPWQQRGTAPVLSGDIMFETDDGSYSHLYVSDLFTRSAASVYVGTNSVAGSQDTYDKSAFALFAGSDSKSPIKTLVVGERPDGAGGKGPKNEISQVVYGGFNVEQLRLCIQTQKWLERNARAGTRYTELLRAHFGVSPTDARLDRPEYIGGSKTPIVVSEVLQTSASPLNGQDGSPQGTMAGHGISIDQNYVAKYRVEEFGLIMGLAYIVPKHEYGSQGINRQWLRRNKLDFFWPEFAHLSEQGIETAEIFATNDATQNIDVFGYIGRYDEMRHKQSMVCADFRDDYQDWTLNDFYVNRPLLNGSFVEADVRKNIFAVQNYPAIKVNFGNIIHAYRPMPLIAEPGLVDHF